MIEMKIQRPSVESELDRLDTITQLQRPKSGQVMLKRECGQNDLLSSRRGHIGEQQGLR
jgi:hypothetical protein